MPHLIFGIRGSSEAWVQYSLGVMVCHWIFIFSHNKASDANIGIIAILVHFEKNSIGHLQVYKWLHSIMVRSLDTLSRAYGMRIYIFAPNCKSLNWVSPKWSGTFIEFTEFSKFRKSYKSLKHEEGSFWRSSLLPVSSWFCGRILVCYTGGRRFEQLFCKNIFQNSTDSVNSIEFI